MKTIEVLGWLVLFSVLLDSSDETSDDISDNSDDARALVARGLPDFSWQTQQHFASAD